MTASSMTVKETDRMARGIWHRVLGGPLEDWESRPDAVRIFYRKLARAAHAEFLAMSAPDQQERERLDERLQQIYAAPHVRGRGLRFLLTEQELIDILAALRSTPAEPAEECQHEWSEEVGDGDHAVCRDCKVLLVCRPTMRAFASPPPQQESVGWRDGGWDRFDVVDGWVYTLLHYPEGAEDFDVMAAFHPRMKIATRREVTDDNPARVTALALIRAPEVQSDE